jgi:ABC-2 type transport system ATP-binding protein
MEIVRDDSRSILFSSHNTMDVERISDQIAFLDRGQLVDVRDKETFLERWRRLQVDLPMESSLPALSDIVAQTREGRLATLTTNHFQPAQVAAVEQAGGHVHEVQRMSLEEIFVASVMRNREEQSS